MTSIQHIFHAISADGETIYKGRGAAGAAKKALRALAEYRDGVARASGNLHGLPHSLGRIEIDGKADPHAYETLMLADIVMAR